MNGKKNHIRRKDFLIFAETIGIPRTAAENLIRRVTAMQARFSETIERSCLSPQARAAFQELIMQRMQVLEKQ